MYIKSDLRENMKMSCGCWADSHCASFDRVNFEFMGKCKYDLVSTSCSNKTMVCFKSQSRYLASFFIENFLFLKAVEYGSIQY